MNLPLCRVAVNDYSFECGDSARGQVDELGPVRFQPSEYAKLATVLMLAWYFSAIGQKVERFHYFLLAFVLGGIPAILIFLEPDLGTAATLGPVTLAMLFAAGLALLPIWQLHKPTSVP